VVVPYGYCGHCLNSKSLHFIFEVAAIAAYGRLEAGPKMGLQEGFG
jgi:hypothetical protein